MCALLTYGRFVESAETHAGLVRKNYDGTTLEGRFRELMVLYLAVQPR